MSKGKHGEPWVQMGNRCTVTDNKDQANYVAKFYRLTRLHRAVACVNALDGRDPEKLEALLDVVLEMSRCVTDTELNCTCMACRQRRALRAFAPDLFEEGT